MGGGGEARLAAAQRRCLVGAVLALALAGCGGDSNFPAACNEQPKVEPRAADEARANFAALRLSDVGNAFRVVRPDQPLDVLRPPLGGLVETARTSSPIFAARGVVVRSSTTLFASPIRGVDGVYAECLAGRYNTTDVRAEQGRVQLEVPRPTGLGTDVVVVRTITRGRGLVVLQIVGDRGDVFEQKLVERLTTRLRTAAG